MEIKNLVDQSVTVTRVQTLHRGDIYKRVEEADNHNATVIIGKVMDVGSNGEQTVVSVIEAKRNRWGDVFVESVASCSSRPWLSPDNAQVLNLAPFRPAKAVEA